MKCIRKWFVNGVHNCPLCRKDYTPLLEQENENGNNDEHGIFMGE